MHWFNRSTGYWHNERVTLHYPVDLKNQKHRPSSTAVLVTTRIGNDNPDSIRIKTADVRLTCSLKLISIWCYCVSNLFTFALPLRGHITCVLCIQYCNGNHKHVKRGRSPGTTIMALSRYWKSGWFVRMMFWVFTRARF